MLTRCQSTDCPRLSTQIATRQPAPSPQPQHVRLHSSSARRMERTTCQRLRPRSQFIAALARGLCTIFAWEAESVGSSLWLGPLCSKRHLRKGYLGQERRCAALRCGDWCWRTAPAGRRGPVAQCCLKAAGELSLSTALACPLPSCPSRHLPATLRRLKPEIACVRLGPKLLTQQLLKMQTNRITALLLSEKLHGPPLQSYVHSTARHAIHADQVRPRPLLYCPFPSHPLTPHHHSPFLPRSDSSSWRLRWSLVSKPLC